MPPEVLAWAMLFVAGSGVLYRFCSWLLRRSRARHAAAAANQTAEDGPLSETPPPLAVSAMPPRAQIIDVPRPASPPSAPAYVPMPAPARHYAAPVPVGAASTVAITADEPPPLRPALSPSIAATLPPKPVTPLAETAVIEPPSPEPEAAEAAPPADAPSDDPAPEPVTTEAPSTRRTSAQRSIVLRAWKLGEVAPRLDIRLKESRRRKVVALPKARKPSGKPGMRGLKVLSPRAEPDKAPVRRIGRRLDTEIVLASTQAQTRVVGVTPRGYRILAASEL